MKNSENRSNIFINLECLLLVNQFVIDFNCSRYLCDILYFNCYIMRCLLLFFCFFYFNHFKAQQHNFEWAAPQAGNGNEQGSCIAVDLNGNSYIVGTFQGTVDFDPGPAVYNASTAGDYDISISKLDANGNFIWVNTFGSTSTDYGYGIDIDNAGNIYITGRFTGTVDFDPGSGVNYLTSAGDGDVFICKYTSSGNFVYAKQFGGPYLDEGHSIVVESNGVVYATGDFDIVADFDPSASTYNLYGASCTNIFVVKLNVNGDMLWAKNTSGPGQGFSITLDKSEDPISYVVLTGPFYGTMDFDPGTGSDNLTSFGQFDAYIWKLDSDGNHIWVKQMGSTNPSGGFDCGNGISVDYHGNIYTTGFFCDVADFDPGVGVFNLSAGNYDAYISKLDLNGNFVWAKSISGFMAERGFGITTDAQGYVYTTGDFQGTADFNPGPAAYNIDATWTANSFFIQKLDPNGDFMWAEIIGGNGIGHSVQLDADYNIYLTGLYYYGTADFDFGPGIFNITAVDVNDGLVYKISQPTASIEFNENDVKITVYPNPVSNELFIDSGIDINKVWITSASGTIINESKNILKVIDVSTYSNGVYFVHLEHDNGIETIRFIKE